MNYEFDFDPEKNKLLKLTRGISFEEIIFCILNDQVLDIVAHPNQVKYGNQRIYILNIDGYAYMVPCTIEKTKIFLKTIFPSRKATKRYLEGSDNE